MLLNLDCALESPGGSFINLHAQGRLPGQFMGIYGVDVGIGTSDSSRAGSVHNHWVTQTHRQAAGAQLEFRAHSHPMRGI